MITIEIPEKKRVLHLPQSLAECNTQQYIDVCFYLNELNKGAINYEEFKLLCLYKLLRLTYTKTCKLSVEEKEDMHANLTMLSNFIDDFFNKDEEGNFMGIKLDFIKNPISKIKYNGITYYGPSDVFQNISYGEYMEGLEYFQKYINPLAEECHELSLLKEERDKLFSIYESYPDFEKQLDEINERIEELERYIYLENQKKSRYLRELFCTFYRPKRRLAKTNGNAEYDVRKSFNKYMVFKESEKFVGMDMGVLYGFFLYFFSFQSFLDQAQIQVGGREIDLSLLFEKKEETPAEKIPGVGMLSVAFDVSKARVFGDMEKVEKTNFWKVILYMYDVKKKYLDEQEQMKSNSKSL